MTLTVDPTVAGDYPSISIAVDAAQNGDTILIDSAGSPYTGASNLDITTSKSLTFKSSGGAANTVVDCGGQYFLIANMGVALEGLTFENAEWEPVVTVLATSTIDNCIFQNNTNDSGLGPAALNASGNGTVTVSNCSFNDNSGYDGVVDVNTTMRFSNCQFNDNSAESISGNTGDLTVEGCTFVNNSSASDNQPGGAIQWGNGPLSVIDSTFSGNGSAVSGGAIQINGGVINTPVTCTRCLFTGNSSVTGGAIGVINDGPTAFSTPLTIIECQFAGNYGIVDGAAVASTNNSVGVGIDIVDSSFYGNGFAGSQASGQGTLEGDDHTNLTVTNCILYGEATPHEIRR